VETPQDLYEIQKGKHTQRSFSVSRKWIDRFSRCEVWNTLETSEGWEKEAGRNICIREYRKLSGFARRNLSLAITTHRNKNELSKVFHNIHRLVVTSSCRYSTSTTTNFWARREVNATLWSQEKQSILGGESQFCVCIFLKLWAFLHKVNTYWRRCVRPELSSLETTRTILIKYGIGDWNGR
jgi:hypothetical protein